MELFLPIFLFHVALLFLYPTVLLRKSSYRPVRFDTQKQPGRKNDYHHPTNVPDDRC
jgi:hypothetical protein